MDIYGIDFTSSPSGKKPLTCVHCRFEGGELCLVDEIPWPSFAGFDAFLHGEGEWIAGIDFPFGQPRRFIERIGWPESWAGYTRHVAELGKRRFCEELRAFKAARPYGDKEYFLATDVLCGGVSPMKIDFVPVGRMYAEGAPRLLNCPAMIPHLKEDGDRSRIIVEAYPGAAVRNLVGDKNNYKSDNPKRQTKTQHTKRLGILEWLTQAGNPYGFVVRSGRDIADDPAGDRLDALLCAVQAAWAWTQRDRGYGAPSDVDPSEGWIADPQSNRGAYPAYPA
ncbi:DUF429 domain-containing protein [Paenirhodobacter sp.]|uniref:DUF429 domain-containing protein n=1 Tax=Paenirhodobacter sp. TaxID=1965326 RepID=UPI003B40796A